MDREVHHDLEQAARRPAGGIAVLVVAVSVTSYLWLGVLPRAAQIPRVKDYVSWLEEKQIDPTAMFYTELEAMTPILNRLHEEESTGTHRSSDRGRNKQVAAAE